MKRAGMRGVAAMLVLGAVGCGSSTAPQMDDPAVLMQVPGGVPKAVLVESDDPRGWPADLYTLQGASVEGDVLTLEVRYGGGCRDHLFALVVTRLFMESHPVQMRARLAHDARGDVCKALVQTTLRFDLGPVRRAYEEAYGQGSEAVILVLDGTSVRYGL